MTRLWLRSRNTGKAMALIATTNLLFVATAGWRFQLPNQAGQWAQVVVFLPVALGCFLPLMTVSAHCGLEALSSRRLGPHRLGHVLILLTASAVGIIAVTARMPPGYFDTASVLRNAALLVGVGLCLVPWVGARLAWIPATVYSVVAIVVPTHASAPAWNLLLQPGGTAAANAAAVSAIIAGSVVTARRAPRPSAAGVGERAASGI